MSSRRLKRIMIKELGVEKHADRVKRKLKNKNASSRVVRGNKAR